MNLKFIILIASILSVIIFSACDKNDDQDYANMEIDFVYSISYYSDSTWVEVCASDASNNMPVDAEVRWVFNGALNGTSFNRYGSCDYYQRPGEYSISLIVTTPDGIQHSKAYSFNLPDIKVK